MKRIILALMLIFPISASAALPEFSTLVEKNKDVDGITSMTIEKDMLLLLMSGENSEYIKYIDSIEIIMTGDSTLFAPINDECKKIIKKTNADPMISLTEDDSVINVYITKSNECVSNIILMIEDAAQSMVAVISGNIPESVVSEVVKVTM